MNRLGLAALVCMSIATTVFGQASETVHVTAIDVIADVRDAKGVVPRGLTPADFILREDGAEKKIIAVTYLSPATAAPAQPDGTPAPASAAPAGEKPWQIVIYFDSQFTHTRGRQKTAKELMNQADRLAALGPVDVIFADPTPRALLRNSRDAAAIRTALGTVAGTSGLNQLVQHRRQYMAETQMAGGTDTLREAMPRPGEHVPSVIEAGKPTPQRSAPMMTNNAGQEPWHKTLNAKTVRPYIQQELSMITRYNTNIAGWLAAYPRHTPRALIMVASGYDMDPVEFYAATLPKNDQLELQSLVQQSAAGPAAQNIARTMAASGWTVLSFPGDADPGMVLNDASASGLSRTHEAGSGRERTTGAKALVYRPLEPLRATADETGGAVVTNDAKIGAAIGTLGERVVVTYEVNRRPDGVSRKIDLRAKDPAVNVQSARWAATSNPQELAEARALWLVKTGQGGGDLNVKSSATWAPRAAKRNGNIEVTADADVLRRALPGGRADIRLTFAVILPQNNVIVRHHVLPAYDLSSGTFRMKTPLDVPGDTLAVVLTIEEMSTGLWGTTRFDIPQ